MDDVDVGDDVEDEVEDEEEEVDEDIDEDIDEVSIDTDVGMVVDEEEDLSSNPGYDGNGSEATISDWSETAVREAPYRFLSANFRVKYNAF